MIEAGSDPDRQQVFTVTEEEAAAIEAGDIDRYLALLDDDAVLLPPNVAAKTGDELRQWLGGFLDRVAISHARLDHGETVIRDDLACHQYTCSWTATPKSGGGPVSLRFRGMHVLRRQPDGAWKISRNIWNTDPATG